MSITAILRSLHILLGIAWVGLAVVGAWILHPAADRMGANGMTMLRTFYGYSLYNKVFPVAAIGTTLAGLILWPARAVDGWKLIGYPITGSVVMAVGVVFGLLAFGHGAGATGRFAGVFAKAARDYDENANDDNQQALETAKSKLYLHSNISTWLTVIAAVCMSSARYLG